jgi:predicted TIM-barrel fold metal-dependent hydrolase
VYADRSVFVTPFFGEPVGWMIEQAGEDIFMFSSDFPHPEGTTNPIGAFEATMDGTTESGREAFYSGNYMQFMGKST